MISLVDADKRDTKSFSIDEREMHGMLASRCLQVLSSDNHLKEDICNLKLPGSARADVPMAVINSCISPDVRYACLYWAYHIEQSGARLADDHEVHQFLERYLLYWLEALSLLGKSSGSLRMIYSLQNLLAVSFDEAEQ